MTPTRGLRGLLLLAAPGLLAYLWFSCRPVLSRWHELQNLAHQVLVSPPREARERDQILARLEALSGSPSPPELALVLRIPMELTQGDPVRLNQAIEDFSRRGTSPLAQALAVYRDAPDAPAPDLETPLPQLARTFLGWKLAHSPDPTALGKLVATLPPAAKSSFHEIYLRLIHLVRTAPRNLEEAGILLDLLRHKVSRPAQDGHLGFGPDPFDPAIVTEGDGSLVLRAGPWRGEIVPMQVSQQRRRADVLLALSNLYLCSGEAHRSLFQAEILEKNHLAEIQERGMAKVLDLLLHPRPYRSQVRSIARRYQLDPYLLYSVARQESKFNEQAGSPVGAQGLMQIMPETGTWILGERGESQKLGLRELRSPETNLDLGGWYLRHLADKFYTKETRWEWTLAAYNAGLRHATRWLNAYKQRIRKEPDLEPRDTIDFPETRAYVEKVLTSQERYRQLYQDPEG